MINLETIKFIGMLERLAELSENGIEPFENATEDTYGNLIFYDSRHLEGEDGFKVVGEACIVDDPKCYHHDIVSYYDSRILEYKMRVKIDEDGAYICIEFLFSDDIIIIENGTWYFARLS